MELNTFGRKLPVPQAHDHVILVSAVTESGRDVRHHKE
jgi:hypothetical protein